MKTGTDLLKYDHDIMVEYFTNKHYEMLDTRISEIITSNDFNRMYGVLMLFKVHKNDKMFKGCLETIECKLRHNGFNIR